MNDSVAERQLFLYELTGRGYEFRNKSWHDDWERFDDDQLNMVWEMWCASAQRDGYKLVPVEPTERMLDAARRRQWDDLSSPLEDMDMLKYKAMIEAAE